MTAVTGQDSEAPTLAQDMIYLLLPEPENLSGKINQIDSYSRWSIQTSGQ